MFSEWPGKSLRQATELMAVTLVLGALLALATGFTLGLFLGGILLGVLLIPYVSSAAASLDQRLLKAGAVADAIGIIWMIAVIYDSQLTLKHWLAAYAMLLAVATLELGLMALLQRLRLGVISAAGGTVLIMVLWMGSPFWLLHHLQTPGLLPWMYRLIAVHPLLALNGSIPVQIWSEATIAYQWLNLNQDVVYSLPATVIPAILTHTLTGLALLGIAHRLRRQP